MALILNDEQKMLQDQLRALLEEKSSPDSLRLDIDSSALWNQPLWTALAELGVLGANIPEEFGGIGLGALDLAIVAQELGRAVAATPFFSSACQATEAMMIAGTQDQKSKWLPRLASGELVATLAWTEGPTSPNSRCMKAVYSNGKLSGVKSPVADAGLAQLCVVVALHDGQPQLFLVEMDQATIQQEKLNGIDELRHFWQVAFQDAIAEPMDAVDGAIALDHILNRSALYSAFEQVGGAESALKMVSDYTQQRYIFGRKLSSYQALKHRLADDYARIELAHANALYAAESADKNRSDIAAACATARLSATEAYETIARDNLQFHGGIGFTWEANCHFHYRRARMLALHIGSAEFWSDRLIHAVDNADEPQAKVRASKFDKPDSEEDATYRSAAHSWLSAQRDEFLPKSQHWETEEGAKLAKDWTKKKHQAGYSAIAHPAEFGGMGGTRRQQQIFAQEEAKLGLTMPIGGMGYAQSMAAIGKHGTPEQRKYWESLTYSGDIYWCQLFSEPSAGSDLAAVRTRAVRQGDKWIVNGQKVWTSGGHLSDYGILLARTDFEATKHAGLSFFIIDMRQAGVTTRPIRQINGQTGFCETFLVDAEIPDAWRLDDLGKGWAVAMTVLAAERNTTRGIGEGERRRSATSSRSLIDLARAAVRDNGTAFDSAAIRQKIAGFHTEAQGIKNFSLRLQQQVASGETPSLGAPIIKLTATNRIQQVQAFLMDLDEAGGIVEPAGSTPDTQRFLEYMTSASSRIAGGADEVLRNQLAERALGLPGDMRADKDVPFSSLPT